tara:strand:- start:74 stop:1147 length:1074 start_codon:yes stop_codon:yes gene_type:complete
MLRLEYKPYTLNFKFNARTSRGTMKTREVWFLRVWDTSSLSISGIGEVAPLYGLSNDSIGEIPQRLRELVSEIEYHKTPTSVPEVYALAKTLGNLFPAIRMGLEMAFLDFIQKGRRRWFNSPFLQNKMQIKTNALVWMGDEVFMRDQIQEKVNLGFDCVKLKIGALDFKKELELVAFLRKISSKIIIRLDANGAFEPFDALKKLNELSEFNIHSIEQPIQKGKWKAMNDLCQLSKIPIALDEELIGIEGDEEKKTLLDQIKPAYIVLKPSLLGGFMESNQWIKWAEDRNIGWWVTSALESNLGLNAISQFVGQYPNLSYQGLGTGALYHNNFASRVSLTDLKMSYIETNYDELPFDN